MERCGGARVANDQCEEVKDKGSGNETMAAPASDIDSAPPVLDEGVSVDDAHVGTQEAVSHGVSEVVTSMTIRGGSSSNIAKRLKRAGRYCKAAAARLFPYKSPTPRRYDAHRKRGMARRTGTAKGGHLYADEAVSAHHVDVDNLVPLAIINVGSQEDMEASHVRPSLVRVATWMYCAFCMTSL